MRVLLVEPYYGGSHRAWVDGYVAASRHDIHVVSHEARFWKWRMRGAHVTLAAEMGELVAEVGPPDVVLATSMTDLAGLLGMTRRLVGDVPAVLYVHETQLTYPLSPLDRPDATYAMLNWTAMNAADLVLFNSAWHRDHWFVELPGLLRSLPDHRHDDLVDEVARRAEVLPVGVDLRRFDPVGPPSSTDAPPVILWNHRWEHDKRPDLFATAIHRIADAGLPFRLALAGERFVNDPPELEGLRERFPARIIFDGDASADEYVDLLRRADIVVSTAEQENFGISITEAVYAGACPLVPNAQVYPERIPTELHAVCLYDPADGLVDGLRRLIENGDLRRRAAAALGPAMRAFDWSVVGPVYDDRIDELVAGRHHR